MKGNAISRNKLSVNALDWLRQLEQTLVIKEYGPGTIRSYVQEMTLLFKFYEAQDVESITQADIEKYILHIKKVHLVGRAKCRSVAQACSFSLKSNAVRLHSAEQFISQEAICFTQHYE